VQKTGLHWTLIEIKLGKAVKTRIIFHHVDIFSFEAFPQMNKKFKERKINNKNSSILTQILISTVPNSGN
jgi:hypothetical protein